jgi:hypothetical protein
VQVLGVAGLAIVYVCVSTQYVNRSGVNQGGQADANANVVAGGSVGLQAAGSQTVYVRPRAACRGWSR